jgi:hypothetical protein
MKDALLALLAAVVFCLTGWGLCILFFCLGN